jgi:EcoRII C terminal
MRVAVKRLAVVEVDPSRSHQHELNATVLRRQLAFPEGRSSGPLTIVMHSDKDAPEAFEGRYTFSNVREGKPRPAEYHMYYTSAALPPAANPGDLLVLLRDPASDALHGVIAAAGSVTEQELLDALLLDIDPYDVAIKYVDGAVSKSQATAVVAALTRMPTTFNAIRHPVYASAVKAGKPPSGKLMAEAASELVAAAGVTFTDPDLRLEAVLAAETELFLAIRSAAGEAQLNSLIGGGATFGEIESYFMKRAQSAKARRGMSLMIHFGDLLTANSIRYTAECQTGKPPSADFMIPSCASYNDTTYPSERLRLVSAKSTLKERWTEVVPEATRVREKYVLTLDKSLTDPVIRAMRAEAVRPFIPSGYLDEAYATRPTRPLLGTIAQLLGELRAVT